MTDDTSIIHVERWIDRFKRHFREVSINTLLGGVVIFLASYAILYLGIHFFPDYFVNYISPVFSSDEGKDAFFYAHPFVLAHSLSLLWNRFQKYFTGNIIKTGLEFGILYSVVALVPILWLTYAAMDVDFSMVFSWLMYGFVQSSLGGITLSVVRKYVG